MPSSWHTAEIAFRRAQLATVEPLLIAARKRRRLEFFGAPGLDELPCAALDLGPTSGLCTPECAAFVAHETPQFAPFLFRGERGLPPLARYWRGLPSVIDLDRYADFDSYRAALKKHSKGGILQQIKKARREGVYSKRMLRDLYQRQCHDIQASKRFRSGPVLAAFIRPPPPVLGAGITPAHIAAYLGKPLSEVVAGVPFPEPPPPECPRHWAIDWGAFVAERVPADGFAYAERLVAYVFLKRIGNLVRTRGVMGHGAYLSRNVVKLLFHDVTQWLLAREDPRVVGVRYLQYGATEHGNEGLAAWKRSFGFTPMPFSRPE